MPLKIQYIIASIVVTILTISCSGSGNEDRLRDISPDSAPEITLQDAGAPVTAGSLNIREDATMGITAIVEYSSDRLRSTAAVRYD